MHSVHNCRLANICITYTNVHVSEYRRQDACNVHACRLADSAQKPCATGRANLCLCLISAYLEVSMVQHSTTCGQEVHICQE